MNNGNGNGENEDPNNNANSGSNNKIKNIILINNSSPNANKPQNENENLWAQTLFGPNKLQSAGLSFITEAMQKPAFSDLYNFNSGSIQKIIKRK